MYHKLIRIFTQTFAFDRLSMLSIREKEVLNKTVEHSELWWICLVKSNNSINTAMSVLWEYTYEVCSNILYTFWISTRRASLIHSALCWLRDAIFISTTNLWNKVESETYFKMHDDLNKCAINIFQMKSPIQLVERVGS